jgi:hypothetical protein
LKSAPFTQNSGHALRAGQRIEQPLPLGHAGRRVGNLDFLQQAFDLRAAQATLGIGEHAARSFKMLRAERWNTHHEFSLQPLFVVILSPLSLATCLQYASLRSSEFPR